MRPDELGLNAEMSALAATSPPLRVLIDGRLRVPLDAPFFRPAQEEGHEMLALADSAGHVDLRKLMGELANRGVNEVLVEAGPRLAGAFARLGLVDEFQIFIAGKFLGSSARPLLDLPLAQMSEALELQIVEMRAVGNDWRVIALPVSAPGV